MRYRVVETDNYASDYPDEKFVGPALRMKGAAEAVAAYFNTDVTDDSSRYYKVVELPYVLQPGFEP